MNKITIEAFNKFAEQYADFTFTNILQYELNRFISLIPKKARIIDLACGSGRDTQYFMDFGYDIIGIDASKKMIEEAKKRVPKGSFKLMYLESLKFPKDSFDAAWALDAISYIKKDECPKFFKTLNKILKKDAIIFLSVRQGEREKEIEYEKIGKQKILVSFFKVNEVENLFLENGFIIMNSFIQEGEDFTWINIYAKKK